MYVDITPAPQIGNSQNSRKIAQGDATRQQLLLAAEEVFFENGVATTTLDMIATRAGMTRGAIYWHFTNKTDLLEQVIDEAVTPLIDAFRAELAQAPAPGLATLEQAFIHALLKVFRDESLRRRLAVALLKCEYTASTPNLLDRQTHYHNDIHQLLASYLQLLAESGVTLSATPDVLADMLAFSSTGLITHFLRHPDMAALEQNLPAYMALLFSSLTAPISGSAK